MALILNHKNVNRLQSSVIVPGYQIEKVKTGMVHIGIGGFHRSHQAYFAQRLLNQNKYAGLEWGICGIALLEADRKIYEVMTSQDQLYTLMIPDINGEFSVEVIGSIKEILYAPENPCKVIQKMADISTKIISLTITEGGYNFTSEGNFNWDNDDVLWDLQNPDKPKTVFGFLFNAMKLRRKQNCGGVTFLSCDNIEHNGDVLRLMLGAFIQKADAEMIEWLNANTVFPNSMVDRITPVTTDNLKQELEKKFGLKDEWPVVCEPFVQWIIEDIFIAGRPEWEKVGAQMVTDVTPYEKMKIRLLNGGHTLVGLVGYLKGYKYIHESVSDPEISSLLKRYMDEEVTPTLNEVQGIDLEEYKRKIIERFKNPFIKDEVRRVILGSSAKFPKFILPTIFDQLRSNRSISIGVLVVANWYLYLKSNLGRPQEVQDDMKEKLLAIVARAEEKEDPLIFLNETSLFGSLMYFNLFTEKFLTYVSAGKSLYNKEV